ncbi:MAG: zinc-binding dehydrogenase [Baekduia sp.]
MRAVVCQHADLTVQDLPDPIPGPGQVKIAVTRCGICGSDLHARHGIDAWAELAASLEYDRFGRSDQPIVMGHEFTGEVAEHGPKTRRKLKVGTPVVALPIIRGPEGVDATGLSLGAPGAYAEQTLVQESLMLEVPNGLGPDVAALTEPMAVAWHAVQRSEVRRKDVAIVIGCGPIGLGVILCLKAKGVETVVASDLSPGRRELARRCGADVTIDPAEQSPYTTPGNGHLHGAPDLLELGVDTADKVTRLPGWWHLWKLGERLGAGPKFPVVFECVGVPGMIEQVIQGAPLLSRVVVVGVCVGSDRFTPAMAINKEIDLRFVLGYTPPEFRDTLHMLADGNIDPRPLITGTVGLDGVEAAFDALGGGNEDAIEHAKILVDPRSSATAP